MPGLRLFKRGFYSHIGANQPIEAGTVNIGCTKGRGSSTRILNYCNEHSANPSGCINQFITVKSGGSGSVTPAPPSPANFEVLGNGLSGTVLSIVPYGSSLYYIGGSFLYDSTGTIQYNYMAIWDDTNKAMIPALNSDSGVGVAGGPVYSSAVVTNNNNNRLYVGGDFYGAANSTYLNSIGIYNVISGEWFSLNNVGSGAGVINSLTYATPVYSVVYNSRNNLVYFGGAFDKTAMGASLNYIASTDSSAPAGIPSPNPPINQIVDPNAGSVGLNNTVKQISIDNNPSSPYWGNVYICGTFTGISDGTRTCRYVGYINTTNTFYGLGNGTGLNSGNIAETINVNQYSTNDIYIGGTINGATGNNGQISCQNIVKYTQNNGLYNVLGSLPGDGVNNIVRAILCLNNGDVYVGGDFTNYIYGGNFYPAAYIAKWNTNTLTWSALPIVLNGAVYSLTEGLSGEIYIGGAFTQVNSTSAYGIIKYTP